ncbi:DUF7553 family protein [Natronorubrum bangense]|uniref:Uncharacterized protein n=2 Tax=Natronorubrum bangense TaxID=61858 RepID=L9WMX1_9EURY|nr:hypothetical protein [Natronorubrum bangense]ELY50742.1 hypothetical protein C494_05185 [Natronorubrum bangense JCM 10635]QCC54368.1 hypothetical protein DV706_07620 [Natronorubrum bangense]
MTDQLEQARNDLEQATKTADDGIRDEIRETADAFDEYVTSEQNPDHAVLDAHLNTLRQARERASGDTKARLENALETAESYRTDLEQA